MALLAFSNVAERALAAGDMRWRWGLRTVYQLFSHRRGNVFGIPDLLPASRPLFSNVQDKSFHTHNTVYMEVVVLTCFM
jgi:hypothetical protein